jgi:hypothetical protein
MTVSSEVQILRCCSRDLAFVKVLRVLHLVPCLRTEINSELSASIFIEDPYSLLFIPS